MKALLVIFALAATFGASSSGTAQSYPSRPITIVVPFSAGGPTDTLARIMSERMRKTLGQPVVIDNTTGRAAALASERSPVRRPTATWSASDTGARTS